MKSDRLKKIAIVIVIIALIVGAIIFLRKGSKPNKAEEEQVATIDNIILTLKDGYGTSYNGRELLFEKDKTTYDDLSVGNVLLTATKYISEKKIDNNISLAAVETVEKKYGYSIKQYTFYKGEAIRTAIKELFGKDFEDQSTMPEMNFIYDFIYLNDFDIYLKGKNSTHVPSQDSNYIKTKTISTRKEKDTIISEIAVAFILKTNEKYIYSDTANNSNRILELDKVDEIPEKELDKFPHFIITLKVDGDNYVFESIAKK